MSDLARFERILRDLIKQRNDDFSPVAARTDAKGQRLLEQIADAIAADRKAK